MNAIKNFRPIQRTKAWLNGPQSLKHKFFYFGNVALSYFRYILLGKGHINFMGTDFYYDARVTPFALMMYPEEINDILIRTKRPIRSVLDIGANIGQFVVTFTNLTSEKVRIDSFEPHPKSFELLTKNVKNLHHIRTFPYGIGPKGKMDLHYTPARSVNASLIRENATYRLPQKQSKFVTIELVNDIHAVTKRKHYDLIKIDVEGYEYEVLRNLKGVTTSYLYIEITSTGRRKEFLHSELLVQIRKLFGPFDLLHITRISSNKFETLFEFHSQ